MLHASYSACAARLDSLKSGKPYKPLGLNRSALDEPQILSLSCVRRRYGYSSLKQLNRVVDSYAYAKIPLETFVTDSQYMNHDQDFTLGVEFNASSFQVRVEAALGLLTCSSFAAELGLIGVAP